ncbi:Short-chain dehydrogenase/reductase SDR [uncultured Pleomorphomonas sp.]|uniref:Short-chain dehydrogenase/reductase SDR n=1 Tax=uncultured Pleomorphomonas sp. TaxID=442121 RepID=A0A212L1R0_9HYPH|nr:SDR family NAD(P)-dependent oxidoreductase [uncultured Pleomorphomonas sp.]SCM71446.1 Short-chain dehydrogenase/reductase SDR [uncultured Pleomorphomonas sp.]
MGQIYPDRGIAVVTGASTGIGFELARCAAGDGYDLVVAADEPGIHDVADLLGEHGVSIRAVEADLSTPEGIARLIDVIASDGRPVELLMANAGRGLGHGFLDQSFDDIRRVVDTNIMGTLDLVHRVGRQMREQQFGRILFTGSIAGYIPGAFQAVYNGTKAFVDSFAYALREELTDTNITVTVLMPGPTETEFFERADLMDTEMGQADKDDAGYVARAGYRAMMNGEADIVTGWSNKLQTTMAGFMSPETLARRHRRIAEPGSGLR